MTAAQPASGPQRLKAGDAAAVAEMERACFPAPWTEEQIRKGLAGGMLRIFGIRGLGAQGADGRCGPLAGYLSYYVVDGAAEIVNFAVAPDLRGTGLGRALLTAVLQNWRDEGIQTGFLEVRASNAAALHLYAAAGFSQVGRRKAYYPDAGDGVREDAVVMRWEPPPPTTGA